MKNILEKNISEYIYRFIEKYGNTALIEALENYENSHQVYLCKTRTSVCRIPIFAINYIEIFGHNIIIHTDNGNFRKYGTLKNEYNQLKKFGFVKCNQSTLIPADKIQEIQGKHITLTTGDTFTLSRNCAASVICSYSKFEK